MSIQFKPAKPHSGRCEYIDLNDIFDFPDVMVSADDDIPSLEDVLKL